MMSFLSNQSAPLNNHGFVGYEVTARMVNISGICWNVLDLSYFELMSIFSPILSFGVHPAA
jgi:hypothetical protein